MISCYNVVWRYNGGNVLSYTWVSLANQPFIEPFYFTLQLRITPQTQLRTIKQIPPDKLKRIISWLIMIYCYMGDYQLWKCRGEKVSLLWMRLLKLKFMANCLIGHARYALWLLLGLFPCYLFPFMHLFIFMFYIVFYSTQYHVLNIAFIVNTVLLCQSVSMVTCILIIKKHVAI